MLTGPVIILTLKILVCAVTILFVTALVVLRLGKQKLHGRINLAFGTLTLLTVFGFELLIRLGTNITSQFSDEARSALRIHLVFSVPSAILLPIMMFTGVRHRRSLHVLLGIAFAILWLGTFVTGVFFLPHH
jgi:uncharacterized membrane protein YozB (DUF420 family)